MADSAANRPSCCSMVFTAIAPKPIDASCNNRLRVIIFFIAGSSSAALLVTIQEVIRSKHRLDEQPQSFLWILFGSNGLLRDFLFLRGWRSVVGLVERKLHRVIVVVPALLQHLLRERLRCAQNQGIVHQRQRL